jgi:uroporphyrin-3 C-methyltransferase
MNSDPAVENAAVPVAQPLTGALASESLKPVPRWFMKSLTLLTLLSLLASLLLWQRLSSIQELLARQSADAAAQSTEARAIAKQAQDLARETAARVAVFDARLSEAALQRSQLEELMQSLSRSRDENMVVDIESAIRLAQQQAQLTGSIEPLLAALKSAEQRVARAAQPRLTPLQRAIARDIDRVKAAVVSDTPGLLVKLDELVHLADELVLANAAPSPQLGSTAKRSASQAAPTWWQKALQVLRDETNALLRVSRIEQPEAALLAPEQSFFLRENFKLKLLNARLGLLARQLESARADLAAATLSLNKYFDPNSRKTQVAAGLLQQVQAQARTLQIPRVDESLAALATAAAGR